MTDAEAVKPSPAPAPTPAARKPRPIATLLLFGLLGPIIGYFVFVLLLPGVFYPNATGGDKANVAAFLLIFTPFILFAHVLGGVPAVATGALLLLADRFASRSLPLLLVAIIAGAATSFVWAHLNRNPEVATLMLVAGAVSGLVCCAIARAAGWLTR